MLNAIDFKKGCYVGQENTARMKLKNKIRRKLLPIKTNTKVNIGDEIKYKDTVIGKILIGNPYPFALIKLFNPNFSIFKDKRLLVNNEGGRNNRMKSINENFNWSCKYTWRISAKNTSWCLLGCSIGRFRYNFIFSNNKYTFCSDRYYDFSNNKWFDN